MAVEIYDEKGLPEEIAHMAGVHDALGDQAGDIKIKADSILATHRDKGEAKIEVDEGDVDWFVSLVDKAAIPIEFGHQTRSGKIVPGLHIMSRASGIA
jgi:hypothetical protein